MNGSISLKSTQGQRSCFEVHLPNIEIPAAQKAVSTISIGPVLMQFHNATISIVDDIIYNQDILKEYLEPYDFTLLEAQDGQEAIDMAIEHIPDLILMDMKMPVMNGYKESNENTWDR